MRRLTFISRHWHLSVALLIALATGMGVYVRAQNSQTFTAATLPTGDLLSEPGPSFRIDSRDLPDQPTLIAYGDQRFTNPANIKATDPRVRKWLVDQIA